MPTKPRIDIVRLPSYNKLLDYRNNLFQKLLKVNI